MVWLTALTTLAVTIALAPAAWAGGHRALVVKKASRGSLGTILVTSRGAALYRFSSDKPNKPTCTGSCAVAWPPLLVPAGATSPVGGPGISGLGTVKLPNGKLQVTYHKMPLYTFATDSGTSVLGQGVSGFFVVHPTKAASTTSTTSGGY
jgi:predicted lipoprotein with Yx(FWY)xxD motif